MGACAPALLYTHPPPTKMCMYISTFKLKVEDDQHSSEQTIELLNLNNVHHKRRSTQLNPYSITLWTSFYYLLFWVLIPWDLRPQSTRPRNHDHPKSFVATPRASQSLKLKQRHPQYHLCTLVDKCACHCTQLVLFLLSCGV